MELELGLNFLLQSLPAIAQIFTALQEENITKLKHKQALELNRLNTNPKVANRHEGSASARGKQGLSEELTGKDRKHKQQFAEIDKILENWPLKLLPSQILGSHSPDSAIPLRIFLMPPQLPANQQDAIAQFIPEIEPVLAQALGEFLSTHYALNDLERPTEFLANAWKRKKSHREASIKAIFEMLKFEPMLILESEIVGDSLSFRIAYWGLGQTNYCYKTIISRLSYRKILEESAINRALKWRETAQRLIEYGESPETVKKLGGDNSFNLELLERVEKWQCCGVDPHQLTLDYKINRADFEEFCQFLVTCHCLVVGWIADAHHLIHYNVLPRLPELLPELTRNTSRQDMVQEVIKKTLHQLEQEHNPIENKSPLTILPKPAPVIIHPNSKPILKTLALNQTLTGHSGKAASIAISRDGRTLASGGEDNSIKLWDLKTGELLNSLQGDSGRILTLAMSSNSQIVASSHRTSERSYINVWDLPTGELKHVLTGHKKWIYTLGISPDGKTLVSGGYKIKVWNLQTGELLQTLSGHDKWVYSLTISPDGQTLVSSGGDKTIKIWKLSTGELIKTLAGHSDWVRTLAISPNGQRLVSGGDDNSIKLWDLRTGQMIQTLTGHSDWVLSLTISPDGETAISGGRDNTIKIWHLSTGTLLSTLTGHKKWVYSLAMSPDGQTLASGSDDKTIKIWQAV